MICIIDKPGFELFETLETNARELSGRIPGGPARGYTLGVREKGPGGGTQEYFSVRRNDRTWFWAGKLAETGRGIIAEVFDHLGILKGMDRRKAYYYEPATIPFPDVGFEFPVCPRKVPVIDGALLFDRLCALVESEDNLRELGVEIAGPQEAKDLRSAWLPYERTAVTIPSPGGHVSFSLGEIGDRMAQLSPYFGRMFSLEDCHEAALKVSRYPSSVAGPRGAEEALTSLCDRMCRICMERERESNEPDFALTFLPPEVVTCKRLEQEAIGRAEALGLRKTDRSLHGVRLGRDGDAVFVRRTWPDDRSDMGFTSYVAVVQRGQTESFMSAVRMNPSLTESLAKVMDKAQRRRRNLDRLRVFRAAESVAGKLKRSLIK